MSASVLVAIPLVLFAIVLLLCFVGCDQLFQLDHLKPPFRRYTDVIRSEPKLVAYWSLGEPAGSTTAVDLKGGRNGTYLSQPFPDDPSLLSAAAPGMLALGQAGIVPGDTVPPHDDTSPATTCIEVNGGYVSVPFDSALNPSKADGFTIEAWVRVGWTRADTAALRVIMASIDAAGGINKGYALLASAANTWQGLVLTGGTVVAFADGPEVILDATSHLVLTYDGSFLRLFVNGNHSTSTATTDYQASTESRLFIGAGGPQLPEPRNPWVGKIQCVALYKGALSAERIAKHAIFGNGGDAS
jgi:hypothetical protein